MAIQYKFFMIPIKNSSQIENELNKFLRTVKVVTTHPYLSVSIKIL